MTTLLYGGARVVKIMRWKEQDAAVRDGGLSGMVTKYSTFGMMPMV